MRERLKLHELGILGSKFVSLKMHGKDFLILSSRQLLFRIEDYYYYYYYYSVNQK